MFQDIQTMVLHCLSVLRCGNICVSILNITYANLVPLSFFVLQPANELKTITCMLMLLCLVSSWPWIFEWLQPKGFLEASLAKLFDWHWAFVLMHWQTKQQRKLYHFSFECQMVPSLLQLVRRGRGHLDAESWSCEILQSPLPCEDSTYYATESSIWSGRHLLVGPPLSIHPAPAHPILPQPQSHLQPATLPFS